MITLNIIEAAMAQTEKPPHCYHLVTIKTAACVQFFAALAHTLSGARGAL